MDVNPNISQTSKIMIQHPSPYVEKYGSAKATYGVQDSAKMNSKFDLYMDS